MASTPSSRSQSKDGVGDGHKGRPATAHRSALPPRSAAGTGSGTRQRREVRSRIFRELVHIAAEQGASIPLGVSTADALQECLDRAVALWRFAAEQVDQIAYPTDDDGNPIDLSNLPAGEDPTFEVLNNPQGPDVIQDHRWYQREREARMEIEKLAAMMTQLGIAERVVRVEEAKAALMVAAVQDASLEVGLTHDQVRQLGARIRERLLASREKTPRRGTVGPGRELAAASQAVEADIADS